MSAMPKSLGGLEVGVVYIETERTFRPEKIVQICNRFNAPHYRHKKFKHIRLIFNSLKIYRNNLNSNLIL